MADAGRVRDFQQLIAGVLDAQTVPELGRVAVAQGVAGLACEIGGLWLVDGDRLALVCGAGIGPRLGNELIDPDAPVAHAIRVRAPMWIGSRAEYAATLPHSGPPLSLPTNDDLACACLPLVTTDAVIGAIAFVLPAAHEFSDDERAFLTTIANLCACAIERLRLLEHVRDMYAAEVSARRAAEAAVRAKDEFLALLGHELRNPLAPIAAALAVMSLQPAANHAHEREVIERQLGQLVRLVDDMLDVARIVRGRVELVRTAVPLAAAIANAVEDSRALLEAHHHEIVITVDDDLVVDADAQRLAQIITNLVVNAAKYTPDRGRIEIAASRAGNEAQLTVHDNGIGIAAPMLDHVFDMFVQGDGARERGNGGLGLGLTIVKTLVEGHGGRIEATSDGPGMGATFTAWLPLIRRATAGPAALAPAEARERARRVLVVDDNVDAADTMGDLLRALGHEAIVVHDAPTALAIAKDEHPDVALVDLGLPILDGCELLARLRRLPGLSGLSAAAITGYGQPEDRERTYAAGFERHLVKPVGLADLRALLATL